MISITPPKIVFPLFNIIIQHPAFFLAFSNNFTVTPFLWVSQCRPRKTYFDSISTSKFWEVFGFSKNDTSPQVNHLLSQQQQPLYLYGYFSTQLFLTNYSKSLRDFRPISLGTWSLFELQYTFSLFSYSIHFRPFFHRISLGFIHWIWVCI